MPDSLLSQYFLGHLADKIRHPPGAVGLEPRLIQDGAIMARLWRDGVLIRNDP